MSTQHQQAALAQEMTVCFFNYGQIAPCLGEFLGLLHPDTHGIPHCIALQCLKREKENKEIILLINKHEI